MEALQGPRPGVGATDAEIELGPQLPLLCMGALQARGQPWILGGGASPTLDAAGRFEPG